MDLTSEYFDKFTEKIYHKSMIKRIYQNLENYLRAGKVLIIYGPRRVGKTTLLENFLAQTNLKYKIDSGDNIRTREILGSQDFQKILPYLENYELIGIDEAQQIPGIGLGLKIIVDQKPQIKVIATGSSSFDLANQIGEPLTGRKRTLTLYPISQLELLEIYNHFELKEKLEEFLVFGSYPEVLTTSGKKEKIEIVEEIVNSYIFKDILALERIKGPQVLLNLLKLLAFQIGNEVSLNELGTQLNLDIKTVQRYLDLLEKSFIITRLTGFSRNLRKEIAKKQKYYFLDNGIRNGVISQFNGFENRNDIGQLWENFLITERIKKREYKNIYGTSYFWRTYDQQEVDMIEEREGKLFGYECKWSAKKNNAAPKDWLKAYSNATFEIITPENYLDFIA